MTAFLLLGRGANSPGPAQTPLLVLRLYKVLDGLYGFYVALPRLLVDPADFRPYSAGCLFHQRSERFAVIHLVGLQPSDQFQQGLLVRMSSWIGLTFGGTGIPIPNIGRGIVHLAMITTKGQKLSGLRRSSLAQVSGKLIPLKYR